MKTAIVMTTINIPKVLESYCSNIAWFGHKDETEILVIGNLKTPEEARDYTLSFRKKAFETYFFDVKEQEKWLGRFPKLKDIIPYNSDNRRNVGYLMAAGRFCSENTPNSY